MGLRIATPSVKEVQDIVSYLRAVPDSCNCEDPQECDHCKKYLNVAYWLDKVMNSDERYFPKS